MTTVGCVGGLTLDWVTNNAIVSGPSVGGNALYAAVGAWLAGATPALCAVVGADYPTEPLHSLADMGFDLSALRSVEGPSFHVMLDDSTAQRRVSYLPSSGRNSALDPTSAQISSAWSVAHVGAIPTHSQKRLAIALDAAAIPFTLDTIVIPGEIEPDRGSLEILIGSSRAFLPSAQEIATLWPPADDVRERAQELAKRLRTTVVATLGPEGSFGSDGRASVQIEAFATRVVDTTGAGDAYCGAFAAAVGAGAGLPRAMAVAAAASSLVIEAFGATHCLTNEARAEANRRAQSLYETSQLGELNVAQR